MTGKLTGLAISDLLQMYIVSGRRDRDGMTARGLTWGTSPMTCTPNPSKSASTASGSMSP